VAIDAWKLAHSASRALRYAVGKTASTRRNDAISLTFSARLDLLQSLLLQHQHGRSLLHLQNYPSLAFPTKYNMA